MPFEFKLPDLGEGIHEAQVLAWKVQPGQEIAAFQPLCEVESAKAAVELTAPVAGRVLETRFAEGAVAQRGDVLVVIDTDANDEWFGIVGSAPAARRPKPPEPRAAANPVRAAPFVRKLARERGVRLEEIAGSGPHGRVRIADVEAHTPSPADEARGRKADVEAHRPSAAVEARERKADVEAHAPSAADVEAGATRADAERQTLSQAADAQKLGAQTLGAIPLRGLRKSIADHMLEAWRNAPQVTSMDLFEVTELVRARDLLLPTASADGVRLTYLPFFVKAAVEALKAVPEANASVDDQQQAIVLKQELHIGLATAVPGGLVVPVVRHADRLTLLEVAREIERLVSAARERRSTPSELSGSTFTITSFGGLPGSPLFATPILNYPEVAILGLGRIDWQPRVVDGQVVPRQCIGVSFTFDHRVLDGEGAGRFMSELKRYVEQPLELLARLR